MQSPEVVLSIELFTVSIILWVGMFVFITWIYLRMQSAEKILRSLSLDSGIQDSISSIPSKLPVYVAVILELEGIAILLIGHLASYQIPMYPFSIIIWAGVFVLLFWQTMSISTLEQSLIVVSSELNQEREDVE